MSIHSSSGNGGAGALAAVSSPLSSEATAGGIYGTGVGGKRDGSATVSASSFWMIGVVGVFVVDWQAVRIIKKVISIGVGFMMKILICLGVVVAGILQGAPVNPRRRQASSELRPL